MNRLARRVILSGLVIAAVVCYVLGNANGVFAFIMFGIALELLFWLTVSVKKAPNIRS
ncbi:hypothetical protein PTRA_a1595 [Pseudoalteromonas translucida KMM 520]|uniref:Uncharacterized protein n=1 Tax=Pseudoalteromonas translucida KMM 520 TaxID=1315283 RepID=A0A0U2X616_9GAMM|nr:hypothetical protein [Pseudoalteromonas translucida]ALS32782.1 hypothetical protein PTRA_a1595 [Pseudoalteromonas translucida KMM 520]